MPLETEGYNGKSSTSAKSMHERILAKYKRHKTLITNFNFMSIYQISQVIFPLIAYPYLIRVLGKEIYGAVAYSNAVAAYLLMLINFGFNISEVKDISIFRENVEMVSKIVSDVFIIRSILLLIAIFLLLMLVVWVPSFYERRWLYFAYVGILLNGAIDPSFYFQGIEKIKFITILSFLSNCSFLILMLLFIKNKNQYTLVPFFTSLGLLFGSVIGVYIMLFKHRINLSIQSFSELKTRFKESVPFFSSRLSVLVIDKSNLILIGSFIGYSQVAYYDLASKLIGGMKIPYNIFNQVLFPNVSRTRNTNMVIKILKILIIMYLIAYCSLYVVGPSLIRFLGGVNLLPARFVLYLLGITLITELISTFLGAPILLATGHKMVYTKSIIYGSLFYGFVVLTLFITNCIGLYQLTLATVSAGTFILSYRFYYCKYLKLL